MYHKLALGAWLAATAGALLVPPAVDIVEEGPVFRIAIPIPQEPNRVWRGPFPTLLSPFRHAVPKGPAFAEPPKVADKGVWKSLLLPIKGSHESLFLNVSTPGGTIQLNEYQLYPALAPAAINTYRVPTKDGQTFKPSEHQDSVLRVTQWTANTYDLKPLSRSEELLKIRVSIDSVNFQHVQVQDIIVDAIKRADGSIILVAVETADLDPRCARFPLLCRWRATAADMLARVRGKVRGNCHKHGKAMAGPGRVSHHQRPHGHPHKVHKHKGHKGNKHGHMDAHAPGQQLHRGPKVYHGHHKMPHGQGRHHSRFACVLRKIGRIALHVVLPILVGLLAGVMAYVLGMLIGTAIVLVWARIRGHGVYAPVALEDDVEAEVVIFEKDGFVDDDAVEEPLPVYVEVENKDEE